MSQKICVLEGKLGYETPTGENRAYVRKTDTYFGIFPEADVTSAIKYKDGFLFTVYGIPIEWKVILGVNEELVLPENGVKKLRGRPFNSLQELITEIEGCDKADRGLNSDFYKKVIGSMSQKQSRNN